MHLNDGHSAAEHHDDAHLQHDPERVPDAVCRELLERLRAVATLSEDGHSVLRAQRILAASASDDEHDSTIHHRKG